MFKFNFVTDSDGKNDEKSENIEKETEAPNLPISIYDEFHEVFPSDEQLSTDYQPADVFLNYMTFENDHKVLHVPVDEIVDKLTENAEDIKLAEQTHSDVVPGVYEGGAKVWECTQDMGDFLTQKDGKDNCLVDTFRDTLVLDLGCGAGVLGILALQNGAIVHFQDYNKAVLENITIPNVIANIESASILKDLCRFYSGDWSNYVNKTVDDEKFDFILTSETIYNVQNYEKIIKLLKTRLKPNGVCYLAAKLHYFGVGGSLRHFETVLCSDETFVVESVYTKSVNVSREVIKISFKEKSQ